MDAPLEPANNLIVSRARLIVTQRLAANSKIGGGETRALLQAALILALAALGGAVAWWFVSDARQSQTNQLFLLPWVLLTAVVVVTPSLILWLRGKFDPFHPLVFAAWSYFLPAFVLGGLILTFGWSQPALIYLIDEPQYNLPLTFVFIALGFAGLSVGFFMPPARRIGEWLSRRAIPKWNWSPSQVVWPSLLLMAVGMFFYFTSWTVGIVGYQINDTNDAYAMFGYSVSLLTLEASVMLWLFVFRTKKINTAHFIVFAALLASVLFRVALAGNKGSLLLMVVLIAMAFFYSGRRLKARQAVVFVVIGSLALLVGVMYGTTFRQLRGGEQKTSLADYLAHAEQTVFLITSDDPMKVLGDGLTAVAERIEIASSLAVVVANHEKLQPYEAAYGLENNIWTYTWTAFIPRFMWPNKPVVSDARGYSQLYFNYGENSFAMTPIGDLLRNFGWPGIPIGMLLLGFLMRVIYATLIENQSVTIGRAAAYYMLLTAFSYEGFYGVILPTLIRVGFVTVVSLLLINLLIKSGSRR